MKIPSRTFLLGLFWCVSVFLTGCSGTKPLPDAGKIPQTEVGTSSVLLSETYRDEKYGFSFRYPADWQEGPQIMGSPVFVVGQPDDNFAPNINVVLEPQNNNLFQLTKEELQKLYEVFLRDVKVKDFEIRQFAGKKCIYCNYQGAMGERMYIEGIQFLFQHKENTFTLTATDSQVNIEKHRPIFDAIFDSFQFD